MSAAQPDADIIAAFKSDLSSLPLRDVVRKHISTGHPVSFTGDEYYGLRKLIAEEFNLHPASVVVVGSTRIGFSLNPDHRYRLVEQGSDIDVAIVSQERFDDYWDRVFAYSRQAFAWRKSRRGRTFHRNLFDGWLDPRGLPTVTSFEPAERWVKFFDSLKQSRQYGLRDITARLYRTWDRLEAYQERSVTLCKNEIVSAK